MLSTRATSSFQNTQLAGRAGASAALADSFVASVERAATGPAADSLGDSAIVSNDLPTSRRGRSAELLIGLRRATGVHSGRRHGPIPVRYHGPIRWRHDGTVRHGTVRPTTRERHDQEQEKLCLARLPSCGWNTFTPRPKTRRAPKVVKRASPRSCPHIVHPI